MGTITCALPMRKQMLTRAQRHAQMAQPGGRRGGLWLPGPCLLPWWVLNLVAWVSA